MKFDIFLSICQTEVDGYQPSERQMFLNFFDQLKAADELGFETAWVAETHLSCQVQKENPSAVIPHFKGEIGLNTDILQLAHRAFAQTKKINIGSAIRNIICNGGPIAHAEAVKTFLTLHGLNPQEKRKLHLGFAAGRFPFSNTPYGYYPQSELENAGWEVVKNKYFHEAVEIFLRLLNGESLSSQNIQDRYVEAKDFREASQWELFNNVAKKLNVSDGNRVRLPHHWNFEKVGVIPFEASLENLKLTIGSHDPAVQILANEILPTGVFNLSITPPKVIEETHQRMESVYNRAGGPWRREYMPRTVMLFLDESSDKAKAQAQTAWVNYWKAMEKTLDPKKVESAVENTIAGDAAEVLQKIQEKYHPDDRLMLWFDFNNHDNDGIKNSMRTFIEKISPYLI